MVSGLARGDWEELQAQGLNPTLEDFDRLNCIALRLTDGAETTCANFPRIGWAGDVPFFEPTFQAFAWFHTYAVRVAANEETDVTLWAYALANARTPHAFDGLTTPEAIDVAVSKWAAALPVSRDEVVRACRYAATGFDDAEPARPDSQAQPCVVRRADKSAAARNLAALEMRLAEACAALHVAPDSLMAETPTRLDRICEAAAVELGKKVTKDEARLRADYDLTLREIVRRLKAAKDVSAREHPNGNTNNDNGCDGDGDIKKEVAPMPTRTGTAGQENPADQTVIEC